MKIVVDISRKYYEDFKLQLPILNKKAPSEAAKYAIATGTPLPEGHRDRTVQDFVDKCRECGRKKVLDKISEEVDDLRNYSYLVPDMIFDEVQRIIDKYKE